MPIKNRSARVRENASSSHIQKGAEWPFLTLGALLVLIIVGLFLLGVPPVQVPVPGGSNPVYEGPVPPGMFSLQVSRVSPDTVEWSWSNALGSPSPEYLVKGVHASSLLVSDQVIDALEFESDGVWEVNARASSPFVFKGTPGQEYCFAVKAFNEVGAYYSNTVCAQLPSQPIDSNPLPPLLSELVLEAEEGVLGSGLKTSSYAGQGVVQWDGEACESGEEFFVEYAVNVELPSSNAFRVRMRGVNTAPFGELTVFLASEGIRVPVIFPYGTNVGALNWYESTDYLTLGLPPQTLSLVIPCNAKTVRVDKIELTPAP
ncbi:MAG: hypothetical protein HY393_00185 [Candidatus Diapherotrites archaeon]|nr:hypothetical protein [Candidatus Diapherotrites archaeon]